MEVPLTLNLGLKLLVNETDVPFVLGDNPVWPQNRFMEPLMAAHARRVRARHVEIPLSPRHTGIQMCCPLSPNHALLLLDPSCYRIGRAQSARVVLRNKLDVVRINDASFLNAENSVFVPPGMTDVQVQDLVARNAQRHETRPAYKKATAQSFSFVQLIVRSESTSPPPVERDPMSNALFHDML